MSENKPKRFEKCHIELDGYFMNYIDYGGGTTERGMKFTDKKRPAFWFIVPESSVTRIKEENA